jgi:hypothetical protein
VNIFLEFIINYREKTGLIRAVGSVWRISHGALPGQAYAHHILAGKSSIFSDNIKRIMYKISARFGVSRNESLTLP